LPFEYWQGMVDGLLGCRFCGQNLLLRLLNWQQLEPGHSDSQWWQLFPGGCNDPAIDLSPSP